MGDFEHLKDNLPGSSDEWMRQSGKVSSFHTWKLLRPFFATRGYTLYEPRTEGIQDILLFSQGSDPISSRPFGLAGDLSRCPVPSQYYQDTPMLCPARDRYNRVVMIKALGPVHEEYWELEILRYLNTEPLRSHPDNRTVPVEDFLELGQWTFAVMQLWTGCVGDSKIPLNSVTGCLNFMEQILNALTFLHEHGIAHLDVAQPNIMMNSLGEVPNDFRTSASTRYAFIDFGHGIKVPANGQLPIRPALPQNTRDLRAPELATLPGYIPSDPFACDVYMAARLFCRWFGRTLAETLPDVQRLFDQMMNLDPSRRPTSRTCLGKIQWIMAATASEVQHAALPPRFSGWDRPKRDFDDVAPNSITEWKSLKLEDPTRSPWEIFRLALDEHQCTLFDLDPRDKRWKVVRGPPTPLVTGGARSYKVDRAYISVLTPKQGRRIHPARSRHDGDLIVKTFGNGVDRTTEELIYSYITTLSQDRSTIEADVPSIIRLVQISKIGSWTFGVFGWMEICTSVPIIEKSQILDFIIDVLGNIRALHHNGIAHLDICVHKILVDTHGAIPSRTELRAIRGRTQFLCGLGRARFIRDGPVFVKSDNLTGHSCRAHWPPEITTPDDGSIAAFPVDIYMSARVFYAWFHATADQIPGLLELLQDMTSYRPDERLNADEALSRAIELKASYFGSDNLADVPLVAAFDDSYPPVPPRALSPSLRRGRKVPMMQQLRHSIAADSPNDPSVSAATRWLALSIIFASSVLMLVNYRRR